MKKIKLSHIILFGLGILTISRQITYGDYCEGMAKELQWLFLLILFICCFIIILIINVHQKIKHKKSTDFISISIFILFIVFNALYLFKEKQNKKNFYLVANENNYIGRNNLKLYLDSTFEIEENYIENKCFNFGNYKIKKDTLYLLREDIESKTDNNFTNCYLLKDSLLIPIRNNKTDTLKIDFKNAKRFP